MKLKLLASAALAVSLMAGAAQAQEVGGWYAAFDAGMGKSEDWHNLSGNDLTQPATGLTGFSTVGLQVTGIRSKAEQDNGLVYGGRVGVRLADNWRVEGQLQSHNNDITGWNVETGLLSPAAAAAGANAAVAQGARYNIRGPMNNVDGQISLLTTQLNVIYDFAPDSSLSPFVGIGLGATMVNVEASANYPLVIGDGTSVTTSPTASPTLNGWTTNSTSGFAVDETDYAATFSGILGVTYRASDNVSVDVTYRYTAIGDFEVAAEATGTSAVPTASAAAAGASIDPGSFHGRLQTQSLTIGLRWAF